MPTITVPANSYAEVSDVEAVVQSTVTFSATTVPTLTQVQNQLIATYHEINNMLRRAGFFVPVVIAGSQLSVGSQLQLNAAIALDDVDIELKDSGGVMRGEVMESDLFLITGDSQYYAAITGVEVGSDNLVTVSISPPIRRAAAAGTVVAHTASANAAQVLKNLHAYMVAAWAEKRYVMASGGKDESGAAKDLQKEADKRWAAIELGKTRLIGAKKSPKRTPPGSARLVRRG